MVQVNTTKYVKMTKRIILFPPKFPIGASELLGPSESLDVLQYNALQILELI
jgi:hypothetical protein